MAHVLSLTDGVETLNLHDGVNTITLVYTPAAPETQEQQLPGLTDGGDLTSVYLRNPTETLELMLVAATKPLLQSMVQAIEGMLLAANRRQRTKTGSRVYLQLRVDGEADTWRSEILSGRLVLDATALDMWANSKVQVQLHVMRRHYWEGPEVELELSTSAAAAATGGRTIYNHDDADSGHDNWVQIADDQVAGTLPTPARLTLTNNSGASQSYWNFYLATNAYADPANFTHILEGEDASGVTPTVLSTCSGGDYGALTWSGAALINWTLSGALLQKGGGRYFRLLARFASISADFYLRPVVRDADGLINLFEGDEVLVDAGWLMHDLGSLPLPPAVTGNVSWANMTLFLELRVAASTTIALDFVQLTATDSYVHVIQRGYPIANNGIVTVDGIEDVVHADGHLLYTPIAMPPLLFPQRTQRILVLHDEQTGSADIGNTFSLRAYCRPRRTTV